MTRCSARRKCACRQEKRAEVAEQELELREAQATGKADKIAKRERKLREAREELQEAIAERDALRK